METIFNNHKLKQFNVNKFNPSVVHSSQINLQCDYTTLNQNKNQHYIIAKGDSGATKNYITPDHQNILSNLHKNCNIKVVLPNDDTLQSTKKGFLNIPLLTNIGKEAHVLKGLNNSLISLG